MKRTVILFALALFTMSTWAQAPQKELSAADKIQQDQMNAFMAGMGDIVPRMMELNEMYRKTANRDSIDQLMDPLRKIMAERQKEYKEKYPSTALTAMFLRYEVGRMPEDKLKEAYDKLDETARQTSSAKVIANEIAVLERVAPGKPAPDFTVTDVNGKPFTLSGLKGKVVLLDFWASWCVPCRKSNPHVRELYKKYHKKGFDVVYSASDDGAEDKWRKAIADDQLIGEGYHHVLRGYDRKLQDKENPRDLSKKYGVHFLPTKYLIDREGKIVGKMTDEELDAKLKEIFGF